MIHLSGIWLGGWFFKTTATYSMSKYRVIILFNKYLLSLPFSPLMYWSSLLSWSPIRAAVQWQILVRYGKDPVYVYRPMLCYIMIQIESSLWLCHIATWCSEDSFMILLIYLWVKILLYSSNTTVDMSQNGIDILVKTKISTPHREMNPSHAVNNHSLQ